MITYEFSSFNDRFEALAMVDVTEVDDKADTPDKATACVASIRIVEYCVEVPGGEDAKIILEFVPVSAIVYPAAVEDGKMSIGV